MSRAATTRLLELIDEGVLDRDTVVNAAVSYMSEDEVADMCRINDFFDLDEDDEDEDGGGSG